MNAVLKWAAMLDAINFDDEDGKHPIPPREKAGGWTDTFHAADLEMFRIQVWNLTKTARKNIESLLATRLSNIETYHLRKITHEVFSRLFEDGEPGLDVFGEIEGAFFRECYHIRPDALYACLLLDRPRTQRIFHTLQAAAEHED